uniref:Integrase zinc-binding domain-containing protein n=1 Tax=Romanomermis culicivorax TaxID=13658 RepID=A0A915IFB7_ROMCU
MLQYTNGMLQYADGDTIPIRVQLTRNAVDQGLLLIADGIVVLSKLRRQLMNKVHDGHPLVVRAKIKLAEMYWWPQQSQIQE